MNELGEEIVGLSMSEANDIVNVLLYDAQGEVVNAGVTRFLLRSDGLLLIFTYRVKATLPMTIAASSYNIPALGTLGVESERKRYYAPVKLGVGDELKIDYMVKSIEDLWSRMVQ